MSDMKIPRPLWFMLGGLGVIFFGSTSYLGAASIAVGFLLGPGADLLRKPDERRELERLLVLEAGHFAFAAALTAATVYGFLRRAWTLPDLEPLWVVAGLTLAYLAGYLIARARHA